MRQMTDESDIDNLDTEFYQDTDNLDNKTEEFAIKHGLVQYT